MLVPEPDPHEHHNPAHEFGYTGDEYKAYMQLFNRYRADGYGIIYSKHYAHGYLDARAESSPAGGSDQDELGSDTDLANRTAAVYQQAYLQRRLEHDATDAHLFASQIAADFRDAYIDWLSHAADNLDLG